MAALLLEPSSDHAARVGPVTLVCGHAIYTGAIVAHIAETLGQDPRIALDTNLGETDGFLVRPDEPPVKLSDLAPRSLD